MGVVVRYITDPACIHSWTVEPVVRRLMTEFGANLSWTFVMGGLARDIPEPAAVAREWLDVSARTGAVCDPGLWLEAPIASTYPAAMAVIAAAEQATDGGYAYLRALREGLVCFRRKLDTTEALVEAAREAGLDAARFRIDLNSNAIVEIFGAHLEEARSVPVPAGAERALPAMRFGDGEWIVGVQPYEAYAAAARAAGAGRRAGAGRGGARPPLRARDRRRGGARLQPARPARAAGAVEPRRRLAGAAGARARRPPLRGRLASGRPPG